jgi:hypothetical protein
LILTARALAAVWACLGLCTPAAAQPEDPESPRPSIQAHRLPDGATIVVDGVLDEVVWQQAPAATNFLQRDPNNGAPASEPTEVRIVFDGDRIVMGVTCFDSEPDRLLGNQMQRDAPFAADDRFMWSLDPYLDGRSGYFFEINPSGAMGDGLIENVGGDVNKSWDGIWIARVRRTAIGWTAEVEIPFKTINFNPANDAWGANFQRTVRRKQEESYWTGWRRNEGLNRMANAGRIVGLREITQGVGLDIRPYALAAVGRAPGRDQTATLGEGDAGVDFFYNVTPALKANFTVNTDFAETDVDQRRVNLTRFPLFFEERRQFFLDGLNFFAFPPEGSSPFFSRRIGLNEGQPQPIRYGARLVGQAGRHDVGVLQVSTGEDGQLVGEDFTAARVRRRFWSQSHVGGLFTRRDPRSEGGATRYSTGADVTLATPSFVGRTRLDSGVWFLYTTPDPSAEALTGSNAYGWRADLSGNTWQTATYFREFQGEYDAAVGFTPRRNFRNWNPEASWEPRLNRHPVIRGLKFEVDGDIATSLDNALINRNIAFTPFGIDFHAGDSVEFQLFRQSERLDEDFEISDGIVLPAGGSYDFTRYQIVYDGSDNRPLAARVEHSWGDFWDGVRKELNLSITVRPRPGLSVQFESEYNDVDLADGSFITRLYRIDARTQFSPWMSLANNIQYDSVSRVVGWQMRYRWILRPGNDVFVVYTHNWLDDTERGYLTMDQRAVTKAVYTWRF